ncbi:hypothetical protein HDG35_007253 [Paraburkholderia sp. JPY681]|nr:hypothetical protein [Paraburkholderia atlantica]
MKTVPVFSATILLAACATATETTVPMGDLHIR